MGGLFRSNLHASTHGVLESHPQQLRQWVDGSDPTYDNGVTECLNPTHGSGWMVQIVSTLNEAAVNSLNPTHGSGWIVQILSRLFL